jgi:hypothetical protein
MTYDKSISKGFVFLTVWSNKSAEGKEYSTYTLEKRYKNAQDAWVGTSNFGEQDLQNALVVINAALAQTVKERGATEK